MPQVDLETLVSVCGGSCDNKIACETLAVTSEPPHTAEPDETPPDFPPESFWLSKDAEIDWFDRNAFYERKDSTKGASSNNSTNLNPNINNNTTSNSQRFANLKHKASIIGLPKPQKSCFADAKARRCNKPGNTHFFPKRSGSMSKAVCLIIEPSSPKVSCIGRVRSKRDRRRLKQKQRSTRSTESEISSKPERRSKKTGLLASFKSIFRHSGKNNSNKNNSNRGEKNDKSFRKCKTKTKSRKENSHDILDRLPASERDAPRKSVEGLGLGAMNRFASGRRGDILGADVA